MMSINPITSLAAGTGDDPNVTIDVKTKEQLKAEIVKEKQLEEYKIKRAAEHEEYKAFKSRLTTDGTASIAAASGQAELSVPSFQQEENYWCGPATTKQMLHFINGSSQSQQYYATALGTQAAGTDFSLF